jgi:hypothetical protein
MHRKRLLLQLAIAAVMATFSGSLQAQDWSFSFGADLVQVVGSGATIGALTGRGSGPNEVGFGHATIDKKSFGTLYRVRIDCNVSEWGGSVLQVISDWADGGNPKRSTSAQCPQDAPFADLWSTKVQAAGRGQSFLCQFNDADFGDSFVGCGSGGEW